MKLPPARTEAFLDRPDPALPVVLLYGPDAGLVAERARRLARTAVDQPADPFRVSELDGDRLAAEPQRLAIEAQSLCLLGGRRLVRVRGAGDPAARALELLLGLERIEALVLLEAGELAPASRLRQLAERAPQVAVIGCWPEGERDRLRTIRALLAEHGLQADAEALAFLVEHSGADRGVIRAELDTLALYLGPEGGPTVRLEDVAAVVGDSAVTALDDTALAAVLGDAGRLERELSRLSALGEAPVRILRTVTALLVRLLRLLAEAERGTGLEAALAAARPPIHFRLKERFALALRRWPPDRLMVELAQLVEAEAAIKRGGRPDAVVCRRALAALCDRATRLAR